MNQVRIQQLQAFLAQEPDDVFLLYALAQEYIGTDTQQAKFYLNQVLDKDREYLPAYYALASLYTQLGESQHAKTMIEEGMQLAKRQRDSKTLNELQALRDDVLD